MGAARSETAPPKLAVVLTGAGAHLGAEQVATAIVDLWGEMGADDVYEPIVRSIWPTGAQFLLGVALGPGDGTTSLLDTRPLHRTAAERFDAARLHANIVDPAIAVDAVGVVATRVPPTTEGNTTGTASGRSVLFLDERVPSG